MGVHRWKSFLIAHGWIPDPFMSATCCTDSPWRDPSAMDQPLFVKRITRIPPNSTILIDGNGLAMHLQSVAYTRYILEVLQFRKKKSRKHIDGARIGCSLVSVLSEQERILLVPCHLKQKILYGLTKTYIKTLKDSGMNVIVYWDGEKRFAVKQDTDSQRKDRRLDEWERLHQYCTHGALPQAKTVCEWFKLFPRSQLCGAQVMNALAHHGIQMITCEEEADRILAQAATGSPNTYVLGDDTDFCFFPDINYIPFSSLDADPEGITASVIRRDELCKFIGLQEEILFIELAILCGNDYLTEPRLAKLDFSATSVQKCIDHIISRGATYRVKSDLEDVSKVLSFIRALYMLDSKSMQEFQLYDRALKNLTELSQADFMPRVPEAYFEPLKTYRTNNMKKFRGVILKSMQMYNRNNDPLVRNWIIDQVHMDVFTQTTKVLQYERPIHESGVLYERQRWDDMFAVYFIEMVIATIFSKRPSNFYVYKVFDAYTFHCRLLEERRKQASSSFQPAGRDVSAKHQGLLLAIAGELRTAQCPLVESKLLDIGASSSTSNQVDNNRAELMPSKEAFPNPSARETITPEQQSVPPRAESSIILKDRNTKNAPEDQTTLPIDEYESTILSAVKSNRVTIIHAETGAGKSTRVPCMLLKANNMKGNNKPRLFISQPRRIAAKSLVERLRKTEPELRDCFALRLGHGVREYDNENTRAWFCTSGYLVRLLANNPEKFARIDYIVIDEVHERSVENDLLCLLCRRLLQNNDRIKLILMSATMASEMYREYFNVQEPAIFVGARRFPVHEVYIEELVTKFNLPPKTRKSIEIVNTKLTKMKCLRVPDGGHMDMLYSITTKLILEVGKPGSAVLIFVAGMNDIQAMFALIKDLNVPGIRYICLPIHGDIPFEDQMQAFRKCNDDEVKVIVATNAAESSLTLPDVDNVICFGLCKRIEYNELSHRQLLSSCWISQANARQRAGRVGRVRPGHVYRLYTRENFEQDMQVFENGEIVRTPLDSVILSLKHMMNDNEVTSKLLEFIEPPEISTIDRSFESLHKSSFITSPNDQCEITYLGKFVSQVGIDLSVGSLIGLGIQFGVASEAIQLAGVLTSKQSPWIRSNPFYNSNTFNITTKKSFVSQCKFDGGLLSEPFAIMNMLYEYENTPKQNLKRFFTLNNLHHTQVLSLAATCTNLRKKVANFLDVDEVKLEVKSPPKDLPHAKITILRVLQVWVFNDSIICCDNKNLNIMSIKGFNVKLHPKSDRITQEDVYQFLDKKSHPCTLIGWSQTSQECKIPADVGTLNTCGRLCETLSTLEERYISYGAEKNLHLLWITSPYSCLVFVNCCLANSDEFQYLLQLLRKNFSETFLLLKAYKKTRRGVGARPCGLWETNFIENCATQNDDKCFHRFQTCNPEALNESSKSIEDSIQKLLKNDLSLLGLKLDLKESCMKRLKIIGRSFNNEKGLTEQDIRDLFSVSEISEFKSTLEANEQSLFFPAEPNQNTENIPGRLFINVPEGVRLIAHHLNKRYKEKNIELFTECDVNSKNAISSDQYDANALKVIFPKEHDLHLKWRRMRQGQRVITGESVQALAMPPDGTPQLYCCAAHSLEIRKSGKIMVHGLTILPPGPLFVQLCLLSFGLFQNDELSVKKLHDESLSFIRERTEQGLITEEAENDWSRRIYQAITFNQDCKYQGESLICFPEKVKDLCEIFDAVDGHSFGSWNADDNPLALCNMGRNPVGISSNAASLKEPGNTLTRQMDKTEKTKADTTDILSVPKLEEDSLGNSPTVSLDDEIPNKDGSYENISLKEWKTRFQHVWSGLNEFSTVDQSFKAKTIIMEALNLCSDHLNKDSIDEIMLACSAMKRDLVC